MEAGKDLPPGPQRRRGRALPALLALAALLFAGLGIWQIARRAEKLALIAAVAQCFRWFRINSRPTDRSASCTEEICIRMSAQ